MIPLLTNLDHFQILFLPSGGSLGSKYNLILLKKGIFGNNLNPTVLESMFEH